MAWTTVADGTAITDPPAAAAPNGLLTLVLNTDIGTGTFDVAFTATPLAADDMLQVWATVQNSAGKNYVENLMRLIVNSTAAQASPLDIETELAAKFGTLQVGQKVTVKVAVFDSVTGLLSNFLRADSLIIDTP